jgi:beta-N-acetylhexosaminidase
MSPRHLRRQIGQLLMAGFNGPELPVELVELAREFSLGGVVFFARNVQEPVQVAEAAWQVRRLEPDADLAPWVAVDQEGGRVARFKRPFTEWPPMATLGRSADMELVRRFATAIADELLAVGMTLDFAPVLDVFTNPLNRVIGDRALAGDAGTVAAMGSAIIETFQQAGLAACGKHFPGHGDTIADSHHDLPVAEHEASRLREVEFEPFRAAVRADAASLMTCHVVVPAFDEENPATLSAPVVEGLLRGELGYRGLVFTDDMEMKAIAARMPVPEAAVRAVQAGCDVVLVCSGNHDLQLATLEALVHAVEQEVLPYRRVEEALGRQRAAKQRFLARPVPVGGRHAPPSARVLARTLGSEAHQAVAAEMARFA